MIKPAAALLHEALRLPVKERERLVEELVISIDAEGDGTPPEELDKLWAAELTRRAEGAIKAPRGVSINEAMKRVQEGVAKKRGTQSKAGPRRAR